MLDEYTLHILEKISNNYRVTKNGNYEAYYSDRSSYINLGTYKTEYEARTAVFNARVKRLIKAINESGLSNLNYKIFEDFYLVFENGVILNIHGYRITGMIDRHGYAEVILNGKMWLVHRLVAYLFIDNPLNKNCVNHINGVKLDNDVKNLEWVTYSENTIHAYSTGLEKPENSKSSKLSPSDVLYIRNNYIRRDRTCGRKALAEKFGISVDTISDIVSGNTWRYLNYDQN